MTNRTATRDADVGARLAVIEQKIETVIEELAAIREYIPGAMIQHSEKIAVLERNARTAQWLGAALAVALIGSFLGHVLGR